MAMIMRLAAFFPARVLSGDGIEVIRTGGSMIVAMNWDNIQQASLPVDPENYEFTLRNEDDGTFIRVPVEQVILPQVTWSTLSGKPATFPPAAHTHPISEVDLLQAALDGKVDDTDVIDAAHGGTSFSTYATGDMIYASGTNTLAKRAAGTNGYVLTMTAGVPAWAAPATAPSGSVIGSAFGRYVTYTTGSSTMSGGTDTVPQNTDGTELTTQAYTPTSSTSTLRITVMGQCTAASTTNLWVGLFRDSTAAAKASELVGVPSDAGAATSFALSFQESAGSTSATTYKVRIGNLNGASVTWAVNGSTLGRRLGGSSGITILIEEIKA